MFYNIERQRQNSMGKSNVAEKFVVVPEVVTEVAAPAPVMTIVKEEPVRTEKPVCKCRVQWQFLL